MEDEQTSPSELAPPRGRFTIVYMIHEAFRRDLKRLSSALRAPDVDHHRAGQLSAHWAFIEEQLHHHHEVEDASLWPLVRPKLSGQSDQLTVLDEMESQHKELLPQCAAVGSGFTALVQQPSALAGNELAGNLDELGIELGSHLEDEEVRCFPVIDEALTPEEFESFGKATAKAVGMRGSAKFFPWIFDTANPAERKAVLSMPPPPVRVLCQYVWEPRYTRKVASIWTA
jgi:iron-sulfur cluster repair protein YtfE (RIC family)